MKNLIRYFVLQVWHSRLLLFILFLSFIVHSVGLGFLKGASVNIQGNVAVMGAKQGLFLSIFLDLFCGSFLAAIFGIWLIPYFYESQRALLFNSLPVPKWKNVAAHAVTFLSVVFLQKCISFLTYVWKFSGEGLSTVHELLPTWLLCHFFEALVFLGISFGLAFGTLMIGAVATFVLSGIYFFVSQIFGIFFQFNWSEMVGVQTPKFQGFKNIYDFLPPVGRLVFDLRALYGGGGTFFNISWIWIAWLVIFCGLFLTRIQLKKI